MEKGKEIARVQRGARVTVGTVKRLEARIRLIDIPEMRQCPEFKVRLSPSLKRMLLGE